MLSLSNLYLITGDLDACQNQLTTLLKSDPDNESATVVCPLLFSAILPDAVGCGGDFFCTCRRLYIKLYM